MPCQIQHEGKEVCACSVLCIFTDGRRGYSAKKALWNAGVIQRTENISVKIGTVQVVVLQIVVAAGKENLLRKGEGPFHRIHDQLADNVTAAT